MLEGLRTAAAGMRAQQQMLDAVSNDLANANTNGYKRVRVGFSDLLYERAGRPTDAGVELGTGSRAVQAGRSFEQGALRPTGEPLDVAIQGEGFMKVKLSDGRQALTRDGGLHVDGTGKLVTSTGGVLQPQITIPANTPSEKISIAKTGNVLVDGRRVGRIELVPGRAINGLDSVGQNAFVPPAASGNTVAAPATTTLAQGV